MRARVLYLQMYEPHERRCPILQAALFSPKWGDYETAHRGPRLAGPFSFDTEWSTLKVCPFSRESIASVKRFLIYETFLNS
jgi:hypothetical protein